MDSPLQNRESNHRIWVMEADEDSDSPSFSPVFSTKSPAESENFRREGADEEEEESSPPEKHRRSRNDSFNYMYSLHQQEQLPSRGGLSKHFKGRSQSFTLLSVKTLEDLAMPQNPYNTRLKQLRESHHHGRLFPDSKVSSCGGGERNISHHDGLLRETRTVTGRRRGYPAIIRR